MKNFLFIASLFISVIAFNSCKKEISEPEQKADGSNVIYLKIDDQEEFLLDSRNKRLHKKTAGKFDDYDNQIVKYYEYTINNKVVTEFSIYLIPFNYKKAELQKASIVLRFDKQTQLLDTSFLRAYLKETANSVINFHVNKNEYKEYYVNSILDYKLIKLDTENKIFTFSANCTYSRKPLVTPTNPKIYFYIDIKYSL